LGNWSFIDATFLSGNRTTFIKKFSIYILSINYSYFDELNQQIMRNAIQRRQQTVLLSFLALWGVVQSFVIIPTFPPWSSKCSQAFLRNDDCHMVIANNNKHNNPLQRQNNSSILQSTSVNTDTSNLSMSASGFTIKSEGLTCSHDGGTTYQLKHVNYVLPQYAKIRLLGQMDVANQCPCASLP